jgi:hypothetical protein
MSEMNLDDLEPGAETDRLVAEAIGAIESKWSMYEWVLNGKTIGREVWGREAQEGDWEWEPSTDIRDAFWAAEQVCPEGSVALTRDIVQSGGFGKMQYTCRIAFWDGRIAMLSADTPAMAICEAILKLKETDNA